MSRKQRWIRFAGATLMVAIVWLVLLPRVARIERVQERIRRNRDADDQTKSHHGEQEGVQSLRFVHLLRTHRSHQLGVAMVLTVMAVTHSL